MIYQGASQILLVCEVDCPDAASPVQENVVELGT